MTAREWTRTFADPAALADLREAARDCMAQVCDHSPALCGCSENRMTPDELVAWIEREVILSQQRPQRIEPAGRPGRKDRKPNRQLSLALAG